MEKSSYGQRDYAFGQAMLTLRRSIGVTQGQLAEQLGVSRNAVGYWEAGESYPRASHLKHFIVLGVRASAFAAGHEAEEIRALWQAARQKVRLDEPWLSTLLSQQPPSRGLLVPRSVEQTRAPEALLAPAAGGPRVDWGEALAIPTFYGRERELTTLCQWVLQERCRVVSVLGMGGIGKSALVTRAMYQLAAHFQVVIFRSLRDAPSCEEWLADCLQVLAPEPMARVPQSLQHRLSLLLEHLRSAHVLLVLDNLEALLSEGDVRSHVRPGLEGYAQMLRQVAETAHQSCLVLTSREKPAALRALEGRKTLVRALRLAGLDTAACEQLLVEHEVVGSQEERAHLIEGYAGNPLALKIVAETIADLFGGAIGPFLAEGTLVFGSLVDLLEEQVGRLSTLEQTLLFWLAIMREPLTLQELLAVLVGRPERGQVLEAIDSLRRRCLIEPGHHRGSFTLHPVVLEYVTAHLVEQASGEIQQGRLSRLREHGLCLAQAKDYVRQTQQRLLVSPLLARLQRAYHRSADVEKQVCALLDQLREEALEAQGYGPANLVMVLGLLRGHLRGLDLSRLVLCGVPLQGVELQDATLAGAQLEECVLTETFDAITAVAISPDGHYWAAGSRRGEVRVWESGREGEQAADPTLHRMWQAHTETTCALAFSPDGRLLASGSWDGTLTLWDVESSALLWTDWLPSDVQSLAIAPDGSLLATGSSIDATVRLWDLKLGTQVQTLPHPRSIHSLAWCPDGSRLATGDLDGHIRLWEIGPTRPGAYVRTLAGHSHHVLGLAFAPDGRTLASASLDQTVKLWDVGQEGSPSLRETLTGHTDVVVAVAWSPDGRRLASEGRDHTIWLWDVEGSRSGTRLPGHTARVTGLAFTPDSGRLLSGSEDGTLRLWDVQRGEALRLLQGYAASLFDVDWSPDGTKMASAGSDSVVTIWQVERSRPPSVLHGHGRVVYGVAFSPDGRLLASSGWDKTVRLWEASTGEPRQTLRDPDHLDTFFFGVAWSPDGTLLASATSGASGRGVQVWEMPTRRRWATHQLSTWVRHLAWSPEGAWVVGGGDDGQMYVWEATDGTLLRRLVGQHGAVMTVAFSPDGRRLVSAGRSQGQAGSRELGELVVWDVQSWQPVRALAQQAGVIYGVAWSRDGSRLVSGSSDGRLRWWEVPSLECVLVQEAHTGTIRSLKVSPDGSLLASCGDDGAITLWDLQSGQYVRTLRRDRPYERVNITGIRGLTQAQKATLRALGAIEESAGPL